MFTLIEIGLTIFGLGLILYLVYLLFYSKKEALRREVNAKRGNLRIDRREQERQDRRHRNLPPPDGKDRRQESRRSGEAD